MSDGKEGGRYRYPESFIKLLAVVHAYVLPYRQLEGFMRGLSQYVDGLKSTGLHHYMVASFQNEG
jgi:hypothetical protein